MGFSVTVSCYMTSRSPPGLSPSNSVVKYQVSRLDALPIRAIDLRRVFKGGVRRPPTNRGIRIETLQQPDFIGLLPIFEVPLVLQVRSHRKGLFEKVVPVEGSRDKVRIRNRAPIRNREGVLIHGLQRAPDLVVSLLVSMILLHHFMS